MGGPGIIGPEPLRFGLWGQHPTMTRFLDKRPWLTDPRVLVALYVLLGLGVTAFQLWMKPESINNYRIFRTSFENLLEHRNLYVHYPDKHEDLYKYSPTFALFMAPFRALPIGVGLMFWNLCNSLLPLWAVYRLKVSRQAAAFMLWFILPQLHGAVQNNQSNGIMLGLMLGAFAMLERRQIAWAALLVCLGFYVKVFGAGAAVLFLLYDRKAAFVSWCLAWGLVLAVLPVPITGASGLVENYRQWLELLRVDQAHEMNYSVMTFVSKVTSVHLPDRVYLGPGLILLFVPLARAEVRREPLFRPLLCASLLLWVVIFNHKAEAPTYVIAMGGVALWALEEPRSVLRTSLLWFVTIVTSFGQSDLFPKFIRDGIISDYGVKTVPCIVVWIVITVRMLAARGRDLRGDEIACEPAHGLSDAGTPSAAPKA